MKQRPLILITNDDGVDAPGLALLAECAAAYGDVWVVAPDGPNSGRSSAISVNRVLRLVSHAPVAAQQAWACSGTPVDCVKLAMHCVVPRRPDIVLSGMNHGSNSGNSIIYSGTMGAVLEGCMLGIPSVGFSFHSHDWAEPIECCRPIIDGIVGRVVAHGLPEDICLNVNIPKDCVLKGWKVVRAARGFWTEEYADYVDPHGTPFYWLTGRFHNEEPDNPETDLYWTDRGWTSVVPCRPNQSALDAIAPIEALLAD